MRMRPQTRHGHILPHVQTKPEQENGKVCYMLFMYIRYKYFTLRVRIKYIYISNINMYN